jgi:membrane protein required for colicin V production
MNWLDYGLIAVVAISGVLALLRGLLGEAMGLLVWVTSYLLACRLDRWAGELLSRWSGPHQDVASSPLSGLSNVTGQLGVFVVLFLLTSLVMRLLTVPVIRRLHSLAGSMGLSWTDRLLGFAFGLVRGVGVVLLGFLVLRELNIPEPGWVGGSELAPLSRQGASYLADWLPQDSLLGSEAWGTLSEYGGGLLRWPPIREAR